MLAYFFLSLEAVALDKFLEYRFWKNHGQLIFDYSLNERHAINGIGYDSNENDCLFSDRGLYFNDVFSQIKTPLNNDAQSVNLAPTYTIIMWIKENEPGRYFFRWSNSLYLSIESEINKIYSLRIGPHINSPIVISDSSNRDDIQWNLVALKVIENTVTLYLFDALLISYTSQINFHLNSIITSCGFGGNGPSVDSFKGFLWYAAIILGDNINDFYVNSKSTKCLSGSTCSCDYQFKLGSLRGCLNPDIDTSKNSNNENCDFSKCVGGILKSCSCSSLSCTFDIKTECQCLKSAPNTAQTCICLDGETCCNPGCLTCKNTNLCTSCKASSAIPISKSSCHCIKGFYGKNPLGDNDSCEPCHENCSECTGPNFCTKCKYPNFEVVEGICKCAKRFFLNSPNNCDSCHHDCLECERKDICLKCIGNNSTIDNIGCKCEKGFWKNITEKGFECVECLIECESCDNGKSCINCKDIKANLDGGRCKCSDRFFIEDGKCKSCEKNCINCKRSDYDNEKTECTNCDFGFVIIDGECQCPSGFHIFKNSCVQKNFSLKISVDDKNEIHLSFTKDIDLSLNSFVLETSLTDFDSKIKYKSDHEFTLLLTFRQSVMNDTSITLIFLNQTFSKTNETLDKLTYKVKLYEFEYISSLLQKIIKNARKTTKYSNPISIFMSIFTNPSSSWLLISTLQLIYFIPMTRNPLPPASTKYCKAISQYNIIPNLPEMLLDPNSSSIPFVQARKIGIESSVVLVNIGSEITFFVVILTLWPLIFLLSKFNFEIVNQYLNPILISYRFSVFIRFWVQNHILFGAYSLLNFDSTIQVQGFEAYFNRIISIGFIVIYKQSGFLITPAIILITLWIDHHKIKNIEEKEYPTKYGSLFAEFYCNKQFIHVQYYVFSTTRNILFVFSQLYLSEYDYLQKIMNLGVTVMLLGYLIIWKTFTEKIILVSNIVAEVINSLVFLLILGRKFIEGLRTDENFDYGFMGMISFQIMFQFSISFVLVILALKKKIKEFIKRE